VRRREAARTKSEWEYDVMLKTYVRGGEK